MLVSIANSMDRPLDARQLSMYSSIFITDAGQLVLTDTRHLRNRNLLILHLKILEIHVEQLIHRAIEQT